MLAKSTEGSVLDFMSWCRGSKGSRNFALSVFFCGKTRLRSLVSNNFSAFVRL